MIIEVWADLEVSFHSLWLNNNPICGSIDHGNLRAKPSNALDLQTSTHEDLSPPPRSNEAKSRGQGPDDILKEVSYIDL